MGSEGAFGSGDEVMTDINGCSQIKSIINHPGNEQLQDANRRGEVLARQVVELAQATG